MDQAWSVLPDAGRLADAVARMESGAGDLCRFAEEEPDLASQAGVEAYALEARGILAGGAPRRVCLSAGECARMGVQARVGRADLDAVERLEGILAASASRLSHRAAALEAAERRAPLEGIGAAVGLANGALGLVRAIF